MRKVIVIGTFMADILLKGYKLDCVKPDNISFLKSCNVNVGGNGCNVAVNLKKLGLDVQIMGNIAKDELGLFIINEMEELGINHSCIQYSEDLATGVSIIFIEKNGEKGILQYVGANRNLSFKADGLDEEEGVAVITGLGLIPKIENDLEQITKHLKQHNKTIIVDTSANTCNLMDKLEREALANIDYFLINEREVMDLTKTDTIEKAAEYLLERGCKNVIIKVGEKGAYYFNKTDSFYKIGIDTNVVDTTGAGDAFLAGFTYALLHEYDMELCVEIANKVGAKCVEKIGSTSNVCLM